MMLQQKCVLVPGRQLHFMLGAATVLACVAGDISLNEIVVVNQFLMHPIRGGGRLMGYRRLG